MLSILLKKSIATVLQYNQIADILNYIINIIFIYLLII